MNKTLLAALIVIPMAFFAADKAMGLNYPGGDDKKAQHANAPGGGEAQAGDAEAPAMIDTAILDEKALAQLAKDVAANKKALSTYEGRAEYQAAKTTSLWHPGMDSTTRSLVEQEVLAVLREVDPANYELHKAFSRCPSGYKATLALDANSTITDKGYMLVYRGCSPIVVGAFKIHRPSSTVGVIVPGQDGLLSVRSYLTMYKAA